MNRSERGAAAEDLSPAVSRTEADYNQLPYPSLPVAYSQPAHVAAMVQLFGLDAPDVATARVLELGCASGGNIVPLAVRFPKASFVGVDISQRHVDEGNKRIAQLGLANIAIRHADLTSAAFGSDQFDFIICHGVFSWVPKPAQDAILRICNESLSAHGVASISYNVFPGWHMRRIIRDICLFHAGAKDTPSHRVAKARKALSEIANTLTGTSPYATLLRNEAERLAKAPAAYVLGEFLSENNKPCYFSEFAARAAAAQLAYVCEGDLASSLPEFFFPAVAKEIRATSGGNPIALQQYMDFFSGRPFRRSLLVRAGRKPAAKIDLARLRDLHFAADIKRVAQPKGQKPTFKDANGRLIAPKNANAAQMLQRLSAAYPSTLTLQELIGPSSPQHAQLASKALLAMLGRAQVTASATSVKVGGTNSAKPRAWPLARLEAAAKQPWATGQHHLAVKMPAPLAALVERMDGSRTRAALLKSIEGEADPEKQLMAALAYCARNGLLEA